MHALPGRRLGARTWPQLARLSVGATRFFGLRASPIFRAGRTGDRQALHRLEAEWGRDVANFLRIEWDVAGLENVVAGRRYVVVALHEGFADALALLRLGLDLRFVARDELAEWPTLGRYLSDTGQLIVEEGRSRVSYRRLITGGAAALEAGEALAIFPQGSILGVETAFWPGAFRLAERLDAWILPVALTGSHRVWEHPYSPLVRFGQKMSMRVLPGVEPDRAVDQSREIERELKQLALTGEMAAPRRFEPEVDGFWDGYRYEIDPDFPDLAARIAEHRRAASR